MHAAQQTRSDQSPAVDFGAIFRAQADYVWRSLRRLGVREADLEDVTHEVFLSVHARLGDYDPERPVRPWLFGFALRHAMRYREQARFRREIPGIELDRVDQAADSHARLEAARARTLVMAALADIPIERRAVFVMADIDEMGMPEIAAALGIPLNTGYSRLRLARKDFRAAVHRLGGWEQ